jgi:hypothetical protein
MIGDAIPPGTHNDRAPHVELCRSSERCPILRNSKTENIQVMDGAFFADVLLPKEQSNLGLKVISLVSNVNQYYGLI